MIEANEELKSKIKTFFKLKTPIHLVLTNKRFYNGTIEELSFDFFIFKDRIIKNSFPIFFSELARTEPYEDRINEGEIE